MSVVELEESFSIPGVTPEQCFAYITDIDKAGEWNTFVKSATKEGPDGVGQKVHAKIQFLIPLPFAITTEVTDWDEPTRYEVTSRFPFTAELGGKFVAATNGTTFTYFLRMHPTKFFPVPKIVLKKALKGQFDKDGRLLKSCLEKLAA